MSVPFSLGKQALMASAVQYGQQAIARADDGIAQLKETAESYGSAKGLPREGKFALRQRSRLNMVPIFQCLFAPWLTFCAVFAITSFKLHYDSVWGCWMVVGLFALLTFGIGLSALGQIKAKMKDDPKEPSWYVFLFITMVVALILGAFFGNMNFHSFMQRYYDYQNLNDYSSVDVSKMRGTQMMDAAMMKFAPLTQLDTRKALGFKNLNTYCVTPISMKNKDGVPLELNSYDFWAVGMNCCSGDATDFKCGEFDNPKARSGLRVLEDESRAFYRLAVQRAEAMFHIKASHPLFLYWVEDPAEELNSWNSEGFKWFFIAILVHFFWQLMCVVLAVIGFSKLGAF